jgi:hypothetical protein
LLVFVGTAKIVHPKAWMLNYARNINFGNAGVEKNVINMWIFFY